MPADHLRIYSENYFSGADQGFGYVDYDKDKQAMIPTFQEYLDRIEKLNPTKGKMLDIGAATGFFLDLARQRGWEPHGVEPSDHAASIGRAKGIDVITGTLDDCRFPDHFFDVITLWDVIEHLPEPRKALATVRRLVKPKGIIVINTPDSGSMLSKTLGTKWHLVVPPEHLNLFHRKSLQLLLEESGFSVLQTDTIGKRFTIQYVTQTLAHWTKMKVWEKTADYLRSKSFGAWGVPINLRDNMFMLARAN
jgi:SAM-dependent methyltransferase